MIDALTYPFEAKYIISKKLKLRRMLLEDNSIKRVKKKIAILGGSTTNDIKLCLELFLLNNGIEPEFYESGYDQYYREAMFPSDELIAFAPDVIYIHTTGRNIMKYPSLSDSPENVDALVCAEAEKFTTMWDSIAEKFNCPIIQNNFEMPMFRLMGNKDASDIHGAVNFLTRLNLVWCEYAQKHDDFYICDINYISADYGLKEWHDPHYWYMYKYALNLYAIPGLSFNVANIIKSLFGRNKKGFVLDLDNTLWGGVIGDDGVDNIDIGPEDATGQAYLEFQKYLRAHKQLGVILNVDSKNDMDNAVSGLEHPYGVLRPDDMIVIKSNWEPKDKNFREIAEELCLLPESLVFIDDNPAERHIVEQQITGVSAPDIGKVQDFIVTIDRSGFFEVTAFSAEDMKRDRMYKENAERVKQQARFENYSDYLLSLDMKAVIKPFEPAAFARITQLVNKSNQFNLTTRRYTQDEIEHTVNDDSYITIYGKLEDRFGDNGVFSVVIGHVEFGVCDIELWVMSCRVLKRDMEYVMMDELAERCRGSDVKTIVGHFYPTAKNSMVRELYSQLGFTWVSEDAEGNSLRSLELQDYTAKNSVIGVIR